MVALKAVNRSSTSSPRQRNICGCHIIGLTVHDGTLHYIIRMCIGGREEIVRKAYADFRKLDQELTAIGRRCAHVNLPSKGAFGVRHALHGKGFTFYTHNKERLQRNLEKYLYQHLQVDADMVLELLGLPIQRTCANVRS